jgi:transcriptional regulator with XRE-family HTH domain
MHKPGNRFGAYLRKLRVQRDIGLRKLAMTIGISPTYLSKIERGDMPPPAEEQVVALADILGQDKDVFLGIAGRIASDLPSIIKKHPREYAALLRALRNTRKVDLYILLDALKGQIVEFKSWSGTREEAERQVAEYKALLARIDQKPLVFSRTTGRVGPEAD